jgi:uncharacterized damage-inducible protein DinB
MRASLERLFDHVVWADRRVLELLGASSAARACTEAARLYAHVLAAERVWLLRLRGQDSAVQPVWPELQLAAMDELNASNAAGYARLLGEWTDTGLEREIEYRNSSGVLFHTSACDILMHVVLHGSYHRGQVARALRNAGIEPVNTDFITYVRSREVS